MESGDAKPPVPTEIRLKRFLYLSNERLHFNSGNPEIHKHLKKDNVACIEEMIASNTPDTFFNIIEIANGENSLPYRDNLFFTLALVATSTASSNVIKNKAYRTVLQVSKTDADFFLFIKYATKERKSISSGINKIIAKYYLGKDPIELANDILHANSYHGWTHKDLIKLSHCKTASKMHNVLISFILFGYEKAVATADGAEESKELLELLKNGHEFRKAKEDKTIIDLLPLLTDFNHKQVPTALQKSPTIWLKLIERLSIQELFGQLLKFYKLGFFQKDNPILIAVIEQLTNVEKVKKSSVHPFLVIITCRNFEKGGKPKDPKLIHYLEEKEKLLDKGKDDETYTKPDFAHIDAIKCPPVMSALYKTMGLSYNNLPSLGKRYMITIEVSEAMDKPSISTKNISCLEAAVMIAFCVYKAEKNVTIAVFNGASVTPVAFEKGITFNAALKKVKEVAHDYVAYGGPMDWAIQKKKQIDVFMLLVNNMVPRHLPKGVTCNPLPALERYHKKKGSQPNTKLILHSLGCATHDYYDNNSCVLNLHGFDESVATVTNSFICGKF